MAHYSLTTGSLLDQGVMRAAGRTTGLLDTALTIGSLLAHGWVTGTITMANGSEYCGEWENGIIDRISWFMYCISWFMYIYKLLIASPLALRFSSSLLGYYWRLGMRQGEGWQTTHDECRVGSLGMSTSGYWDRGRRVEVAIRSLFSLTIHSLFGPQSPDEPFTADESNIVASQPQNDQVLVSRKPPPATCATATDRAARPTKRLT